MTVKNLFKVAAVFVSGLFLSACNQVKTTGMDSVLREAQLCLQVKQLVNQHQNGFEQFKGRLQTTKFMDVWDAKYQLVGNNCQIWRWSNGKQAYMCSLTVPDKQLANKKIEKAVGFTSQCLGNEWLKENLQQNNSDAFRVVFSKPGENTVASIHGLKTQGLFKSEWTVYYFIGDRDHTL